MVEVESLKNELSTVRKQNDHLNQKNQALEIKVDETTHTFKAIASHLAQVLTEVRNGNSSAQLLDGAESALNLISSQVDLPLILKKILIKLGTCGFHLWLIKDNKVWKRCRDC